MEKKEKVTSIMFTLGIKLVGHTNHSLTLYEENSKMALFFKLHYPNFGILKITMPKLVLITIHGSCAYMNSVNHILLQTI